MEPLEIHVRVSPDDEVLALRAKVAELEAQGAEYKARADRAEFRYRCEVLINQELQDLCRAHGVDFRRRLKTVLGDGGARQGGSHEQPPRRVPRGQAAPQAGASAGRAGTAGRSRRLVLNNQPGMIALSPALTAEAGPGRRPRRRHPRAEGGRGREAAAQGPGCTDCP